MPVYIIAAGAQQLHSPEGYSQLTGAVTLPTDVATGISSIAGATPIFGASSALLGTNPPTQPGAWEEAVLFELRQMNYYLAGIVGGKTLGFDFDLHKTPPAVPGTTGPGPSGV